MRFVTYADSADDRVGVVDGDTIHALAPGVRLIDLLGDPEQLRDAGQHALRQPHAVHAIRDVRLRSPIPHPPTVRDFMTFEQHVEGTAKLRDPDAQIPDRWYAAPAFYFTNPYAVCGPNDDVEQRASWRDAATSSWKSRRSSAGPAATSASPTPTRTSPALSC